MSSGWRSRVGGPFVVQGGDPCVAQRVRASAAAGYARPGPEGSAHASGDGEEVARPGAARAVDCGAATGVLLDIGAQCGGATGPALDGVPDDLAQLVGGRDGDVRGLIDESVKPSATRGPFDVRGMTVRLRHEVMV